MGNKSQKIGSVSAKDIKDGKWYFDEDNSNNKIQNLSFGEICANSFDKLYQQRH